MICSLFKVILKGQYTKDIFISNAYIGGLSCPQQFQK